MTLDQLDGTNWHGTSELWLDPLGNDAQTSPCALHIEPNGLRYTWEHQGAPQLGSITIEATGGVFTDTFHSPGQMWCSAVAGATALIDLLGSYEAGEGPPWRWRLMLSRRPPFGGAPESLVLQMTNIAPWGEEARAVRMVAERR